MEAGARPAVAPGSSCDGRSCFWLPLRHVPLRIHNSFVVVDLASYLFSVHGCGYGLASGQNDSSFISSHHLLWDESAPIRGENNRSAERHTRRTAVSRSQVSGHHWSTLKDSKPDKIALTTTSNRRRNEHERLGVSRRRGPSPYRTV